MKTNEIWRAEESANDVDYLVQNQSGDSILITLEYGKGRNYQNKDEAHRIAKLAASAPDLLQALILANDVLKIITEHHGSEYIDSLTQRTIELAINKALK